MLSFFSTHSSIVTARNCRVQMSCKKLFHEIFVKFTRKHLCWSLFFNKVAGLSLQFYQKKTLALVLSCDLRKFWRAPFLQSASRLLLLHCRILERIEIKGNINTKLAMKRSSHWKCSVRVRSHERRNEPIPVWDFKPTWKQVLFTWRFISAAF